MCGIYGVGGAAPIQPTHCTVLGKLGAALRHRGPDGHAVLGCRRGALGAERLRVIDLHERADQPFSTADGRCILACNGEIYNSRELRHRYPDYPYHSHSDVEVILPLYLDRGIHGLEHLNGMFGLAIWDERLGRLVLARDRAGEKPLFYARVGHEIWFASEVKALLLVPGVARDLDPVAISQFLTLGYALDPGTMFAGIRQVEAGTALSFEGDGCAEFRYWQPAGQVAAEPAPGDPVVGLRDLLVAAVARQVVAEVPVGIFTSGGLDSSLLAVLASEALGANQIHTFSAQFTVPSYDESEWAERVAAKLSLRLLKVRCDQGALAEAFDTVTRDMSEPLADPAILPTWLLSRAARERVTVILSGEGADELFGGYPTYLGHKLALPVGALPRPLRYLVRRAVQALPTSDRKVTLEFLLKRFVGEAERPWLERHLAWFGTGLPEQPWEDRGSWVARLADRAPIDAALDRAMLLDYETYLRNGLLVKVDRGTMLHSIEARAPYLDRDLTRFAFSLSANLKIRGLSSKWILKRAARRWLPGEVIRRRKRGLSVPIAGWLNTGLAGELDRTLEPGRLRRQGLLDPAQVGRLLAEHRTRQANHARPLWALLVLQRWLERWAPGSV